jgi:hypothetical protein
MECCLQCERSHGVVCRSDGLSVQRRVSCQLGSTLEGVLNREPSCRCADGEPSLVLVNYTPTAGRFVLLRWRRDCSALWP